MSDEELREPDVLTGPGARREVAKACQANDAGRVVIVASGSVDQETPIVDDVVDALGELHAATHVGIGQHAPADNVAAATALADEHEADALVSIGGGSVIDAAKFVQRDLSNGFEQPVVLHIAIPTTLSGAEFTILAGRTTEGSDGRPVKTGMSDPRIVPAVALLDPEACSYTPRWLWAATGIRAIDHAIEGITSQQASHLSDQIGRAHV